MIPYQIGYNTETKQFLIRFWNWEGIIVFEFEQFESFVQQCVIILEKVKNANS